MSDDEASAGLLADKTKAPMPKTTRSQIITVLLLMLAFAFARTAVFVQLFATPLTAKEFIEGQDSPDGVSTIPLSFLYYGGCIAAPLASKFMQVVGRLQGFLVGCGLGILGAGICVVATYFRSILSPLWGTYSLLCLGSLLLGFSNGIVNFFRFAAADAVPHRRSLAISAVLFGGDVAALAGPTLGLWSKTLIWNYGASYVAVAILYCGTLITLLFIKMPELTTPDLTTAVPPRSIGTLLRVPRLSLALLTGTVGFSCMVFLMGLIPIVMHGHFEEDKISHVLQVHGVGMFVPSLFVGFVIERFGVMTTDFLGLIGLIVANIVMITGTNYWQYMLGMLLCGFGWNFTFISSTTMLIECYLPSEKATTQGINDFIMYLIVSTLSLVSGALLEAFGSWENVNYFSMAMTLVALIALIGVFISERMPKEPTYQIVNSR